MVRVDQDEESRIEKGEAARQEQVGDEAVHQRVNHGDDGCPGGPACHDPSGMPGAVADITPQRGGNHRNQGSSGADQTNLGAGKALVDVIDVEKGQVDARFRRK